MVVDLTGAMHSENLGATGFNRPKHHIEMFNFQRPMTVLVRCVSDGDTSPVSVVL
jgi:hypothetical protein